MSELFDILPEMEHCEPIEKTNLSQCILGEEDLSILISDFYVYAEDAPKPFFIDPQDALEKRGYCFMPQQRRIAECIIRSVFQRRGWEINIYIVRQFGKTELVQLVVNYCYEKYFELFEQPFSASVVAHNDRVVNNIMNRVEQGMAKLGLEFNRARTRGEKETSRGDILTPMINGETSHFSNNEGFTNNLVMRDEAHRGNDKTFKDEIRPSVLKTGGTIINIGNGFFAKCDFWKNREHGNTKKNKVFRFGFHEVVDDAKKLADMGFESWKNWIEDILNEIDKYGEDDPNIIKNILCGDAFEVRSLVTDSDIDGCSDSFLMDLDDKGEYGLFNRVYVGCDIARLSDRTIMTVINQEGQIEGRFVIKGRDYSVDFPEQFRLMYKILEDNGWIDRMDIFGIDATGMGLIGLDFAEEIFECQVEKMVFNQRTKMIIYEQGADFIKNSVITVDPADPTHQDFVAEWTEIEVVIQANGMRTYNAPSGKNDDIVAADCIAIDIWARATGEALTDEDSIMKIKGERINRQKDLNKAYLERRAQEGVATPTRSYSSW